MTVPVFNQLGSPLNTSVDLAIMSLEDGKYFDFSSVYGGSGGDTFEYYLNAVTPRLPLTRVDPLNLNGYYTIKKGSDIVPLDLLKFPDGDYLLAAEALLVSPKGRFTNQIGVLDGRLAEVNVVTSGGGIVFTTIVVKNINASGVPIPNVTVVIRTSGDVLVALGETSLHGEAVFNLDPGTYKVYLNRVGTADVYANPYSITVTETQFRFELYGVVGGPDVPEVPGTTRVYGYVVEMGITSREGIEVRAWVRYPDEVYTSGGIIISGATSTVLTNADGYFHFDLIPQKFLTPEGVIYRIEIHEVDYLVDVAANLLDDGGQLSLADLGAH